jgi:allophanate hydrolase
MPFSLDFISLRRSYAERGASPIAVAREIAARIRARGEDAVWISRVAEDALLAAAAALERRAATEGLAAMPLYGLPFAIKDNIDVAGLPTTAACPDFAYPPRRSAPAVERLLAAGALLIGKTNLDQFATGLVGTRSPHGGAAEPVRSGLHSRRIELGFGRRGRGRPCRLCARHRYRRFGTGTGGVQ